MGSDEGTTARLGLRWIGTATGLGVQYTAHVSRLTRDGAREHRVIRILCEVGGISVFAFGPDGESTVQIDMDSPCTERAIDLADRWASDWIGGVL